MKKVMILFMMLPFLIIFMTFVLIHENNKKYPDKFACRSFQSALRKPVPLYVSESVYKKETKEMCQCLFDKRVGKIKTYKEMGELNYQEMEKCSKEVIFEWIMPSEKSEKFKSKDAEICFKGSVYEEIIFPFVSQELNNSFNNIFRNDISNKERKEAGERNAKYQYFFARCNR